MRNRIIITLVLAMLPLTLSGQNMTLSRAEAMIPRKSSQPVRSLIPTPADGPIDTIETSNSSMKIILLEDGTWKYWKDGNAVMNQDVFKENWSNTAMDAYKLDWAAFPDKEYIWLVDESDHYHYPGMDSIMVSSPFGYRHGVRHTGTDVRMPRGKEIYAAFDGKVRVAKTVRGYGNLVIIRHENGLETFYAHMTQINVNANDWVEAGQVIGLAGSTGRASGPHLHFEVRYHGYALDPAWLIDFDNGGILRHRVFTLKKKYLTANSKYVPETDYDEETILLADEEDRQEAERLAAEMKAAKYVTVKSGDTLSRIAANNGTTVSNLCKLNNITTKTILKVGRKIRVR